MAVAALRRSPGSIDLFMNIVHGMHLDMSAAISRGGTSDLEAALRCIRVSSKDWKMRYVNEGSYFETLTASMRMGNFQNVLDALETLASYPEFLTPKIRLCNAACYLQLHTVDKCQAILDQPLVADGELTITLEQMIIAARADEKTAYEALLDYIQKKVCSSS